MRNLRDTIKQNKAVKTETLIRLLNPKITGWANYHRHYCSKNTFYYVSHHLFPALWNWSKRRHNRKGSFWVARKYFRKKGNNNWQFNAKIKDKKLKPSYLDLVEISHIPIKRHVKIKADATPFDPAYEEYIRVRQTRRKEKRLFFPCKSSWSPWSEIELA
jgi:RNA-directed DNA polymerase